MITSLSDEQQQALEQHGGRPIKVVHPSTQKVYVLVAGDLYDRFSALFDDDEFDIGESYAAQSAAAGAAGWDDPEMDVYNDYDAHRPKP